MAKILPIRPVVDIETWGNKCGQECRWQIDIYTCILFRRDLVVTDDAQNFIRCSECMNAEQDAQSGENTVPETF